MPITDDDINEATTQYYILLLEVQDLNSPHSITRNVSTCGIIDNDGKLPKQYNVIVNCNYNYCAVIRIGFAQPVYEYFEPDDESLITNVTLMSEDNRQSEQIFTVNITSGDPTGAVHAATFGHDYELSSGSQSLHLIFSINKQIIPPPTFFLWKNSFPEETEAFQMSISLDGPPTFQPPSPGSSTAFQSTQIRIIDNDGELQLSSMHDKSDCLLFIAISIGFEQSNYTIYESAGSQQACVAVYNPPPNEELVTDVFLVYESRTGTASEDLVQKETCYHCPLMDMLMV